MIGKCSKAWAPSHAQSRCRGRRDVPHHRKPEARGPYGGTKFDEAHRARDDGVQDVDAIGR